MFSTAGILPFGKVSTSGINLSVQNIRRSASVLKSHKIRIRTRPMLFAIPSGTTLSTCSSPSSISSLIQSSVDLANMLTSLNCTYCLSRGGSGWDPSLDEGSGVLPIGGDTFSVAAGEGDRARFLLARPSLSVSVDSALRLILSHCASCFVINIENKRIQSKRDYLFSLGHICC